MSTPVEQAQRLIAALRLLMTHDDEGHDPNDGCRETAALALPEPATSTATRPSNPAQREPASEDARHATPELDERLIALANETFATTAASIRGGVADAGREQCAREWAAQQVGYYARAWFNTEADAIRAAYAQAGDAVEAEREGAGAMSTDTRPESPAPFDAMRLFAAALIDELEGEHSCTEADLYRRALSDIEATASAAPLASNPAPAVDVLRRLVETWEAAAEDTIGENVLALGPLMVEGRAVLAALPAQRKPTAPEVARMAAKNDQSVAKDGAARIADERLRQIEVEGYDPLHDLYDHDAADLEQAALTYLLGEADRWPWGNSPKLGPSRVRDLEKAGALIAAAIDHHLGLAAEGEREEQGR